MSTAYEEYKTAMKKMESLKELEDDADKIYEEIHLLAEFTVDCYDRIISCLRRGAQGPYLWYGPEQEVCLKKVDELYRDMRWTSQELKEAFDDIKNALIMERTEWGRKARAALEAFNELDKIRASADYFFS